VVVLGPASASGCLGRMHIVLELDHGGNSEIISVRGHQRQSNFHSALFLFTTKIPSFRKIVDPICIILVRHHHTSSRKIVDPLSDTVVPVRHGFSLLNTQAQSLVITPL